MIKTTASSRLAMWLIVNKVINDTTDCQTFTSPKRAILFNKHPDLIARLHCHSYKFQFWAKSLRGSQTLSLSLSSNRNNDKNKKSSHPSLIYELRDLFAFYMGNAVAYWNMNNRVNYCLRYLKSSGRYHRDSVFVTERQRENVPELLANFLRPDAFLSR